MALSLFPDCLTELSTIRELKLKYVDKTRYVCRLAHWNTRYVYLSRPRRFGKSLLLDVMACYFEGRQELFKGLRIARLEKDWTQHEVLRMNLACGSSKAADVRDFFDDLLSRFESVYGLPAGVKQLGVRFKKILQAAYDRSGRKVVVLIDEYDTPLINTWHTPEHQAVADMYREVFINLKSCEAQLRFVFITGICKFAHTSLFSMLNNLYDVSFDAEFAGVCGITSEELHGPLRRWVEQLARRRGEPTEQTYAALKRMYDGYHFSGAAGAPDVYNPLSLVRALMHGHEAPAYKSYWLDGGCAQLLRRKMTEMGAGMLEGDKQMIGQEELRSMDCGEASFRLSLYFAGYLTLDEAVGTQYRLRVPNDEVRLALARLRRRFLIPKP